MALYTTALNIDYLIPDVRFRVGDLNSTVFSDTVVRTAIVNGIKFLQTKWSSRYQIYASGLYITPQPDDAPAGQWYVGLPDGYAYIPSGLIPGDVFRNPFLTFTDVSNDVIVQTDEYPIIVAATLFLRENLLSASQQTFINWTDGEYSYSNVASSKIMQGSYSDIIAELNAYFKSRRAGVLRDDFANMII
jgi:hypothetical protein